VPAPAAIDGTPAGGMSAGVSSIVVHVIVTVFVAIEPLRNFFVPSPASIRALDFLLPLGEAHVAERGRTGRSRLPAPAGVDRRARVRNIAHTLATVPLLHAFDGARRSTRRMAKAHHPLPVPGVVYSPKDQRIIGGMIDS